MANKRLRYLVLRFNHVNESIAIIYNKTKFCNISLIGAHAATEEKDDTVKGAICSVLVIVDVVVLPMTPNFYAKVKREGIFGHTIIQFTTTTISNGIKLIDFVAERNMLVCRANFWISIFIRQQIEHIELNIIDLRTFRDPNIYFDSNRVAVKLLLRSPLNYRISFGVLHLISLVDFAHYYGNGPWLQVPTPTTTMMQCGLRQKMLYSVVAIVVNYLKRRKDERTLFRRKKRKQEDESVKILKYTDVGMTLKNSVFYRSF